MREREGGGTDRECGKLHNRLRYKVINTSGLRTNISLHDDEVEKFDEIVGVTMKKQRRKTDFLVYL